MQFAITWTNRAGTTEASEKRTLALFKNWQPPTGLEFIGFYDYADGNGGLAIVEAATAQDVLEATAPWALSFDFTARPIVTSEQGQAVIEKVIAWRDSIP
jgi:hypothetical protein